jgi:pyruvate-formate lyase-activating enzyme
MKHPESLPSLVFTDAEGNINDFPELGMTGMSGSHFLPPELNDLIPLPEGSELFTLPGRLPVGWDFDSREPVLLTEHPWEEGDKSINAVAAFIAPAHTSILASSYQTQKDAPRLPLFAYTAVGWQDDQFWVPAFRSDKDVRQDASQYTREEVERRTALKLKAHRDNRLIQHLGKCCLTYGCPAARNYFLGRWEAPLPTSPVCNARCLGCISLQESGICSAQERITFVPTAKELCEIAIPHLQKAPNPVVSYGQGCEGEPLLQSAVIRESIVQMREATDLGTINLNSNASLPDKIKELAAVGLDSLRVSLNSAQENCYNAYYRPKSYCFDDVKRSIDMMKDAGRFVSLNYFVLPGFTDSDEEFAALSDLVASHPPDFIQLRNLNIDPEWYFETVWGKPHPLTEGITPWLDRLKARFPELGFGYFNPNVHPTQKKKKYDKS